MRGRMEALIDTNMAGRACLPPIQTRFECVLRLRKHPTPLDPTGVRHS